MKMLLAVDESKNAERIVEYVGTLLHHTPDVKLTLFHVLKPLPRKLLEHGGSENPVLEGQLQSQLKQDQAEWYRTQGEAECPYLLRARDLLIKAGLRSDMIELKFGHEEDIARNILEEARSGGYRTIVLGRYGTSSMKRIFGGGITDHVLKEATGMAVWIIE
jgi:nucleotide-binding universal stress UspA family protein